MIDIEKAKKAFYEYLSPYKNQKDTIGFELKEAHTYHVMKKSKELAQLLKLSDEDCELAELIGLLHDIGRFEEMKVMNTFDGRAFNHALYGAKILFEDGLIRNFIEDESYDYIIEKAIVNHNRFSIEEGLDKRALLHAKIIRDSDKLDNFRVKIEYKPEHLFKNIVKNKEQFENSKISDAVYSSMINLKCVDITDRKYPLDFYILILGFVFDLYFNESFKMVKKYNYMDQLIDRFDYKLPETRKKMESIRIIVNRFVEDKIMMK